MQNRTRLYLQRYIIYIVAISLIIFVLGQLTNRIFKPDGPLNYNLIFLARIFGYAWLIGNIVMAIVIYGDMKRLNKLNWWIVGIIVVNKEFGAIVCLLHYFVNDRKIEQDNNVLDNVDTN